MFHLIIDLLIVGQEEEGPIALQRPAEREPELVLSKVRLERHTGVRGSAGDRIRLAEVVQRAAQLIGPRLRDYVDEPAGRAAELCVGAARQHHDLLHGVEIEGERRPLAAALLAEERIVEVGAVDRDVVVNALDRKSTRLNSSHQIISYAVFCLKKKKNTTSPTPLPPHHAH